MSTKATSNTTGVHEVIHNIQQFWKRYKTLILFTILLAIHVWLRFYLFFERADLGWDQVDSAWAAKAILVDKNYLLSGPVANQNTGIHMGPLYFYLIAIVYFFTNLDPIASPIFQGILSIVNFFVLFFITKKLFGTQIALIAALMNTFCVLIMNMDRIQSAFYLIVPISYLIFYAMYKTITGETKYILLLAAALGLSLHIDFVSVFYPILVLLVLPFVPWKKSTLKYIALAIPVFLVFLVPSLLNETLIKHSSTTTNISALFHTAYHGFHLTRFLQIAPDGLITFEQMIQFKMLRTVSFLVFPIFLFAYYKLHPEKKSLKLFYLMGIWILVPWVVLSTYNGQLTDYYFSLPRDFVIAIIAFLLYYLYEQKWLVAKVSVVLFFAGYIYYGMQAFLEQSRGNLVPIEYKTRQAVESNVVVPFKDGDPSSYVYYVYTRQKKMLEKRK